VYLNGRQNVRLQRDKGRQRCSIDANQVVALVLCCGDGTSNGECKGLGGIMSVVYTAVAKWVYEHLYYSKRPTFRYTYSKHTNLRLVFIVFSPVTS